MTSKVWHEIYIVDTVTGKRTLVARVRSVGLTVIVRDRLIELYKNNPYAKVAGN